MRLGHILLVATVAASSLGAPLGAQIALVSGADLLFEPGARSLGSIRAGTRVTAGRREGDHVQVTLTGFMDSTTLRAAKSGPFAYIVRADNGARLRGAPSGSAAVLAEMRGDVGLSLLSRRGSWVEVRRSGWLRATALGMAPSPARVAAAPVQPAPAPSRPVVATVAPAKPTPAPPARPVATIVPPRTTPAPPSRPVVTQAAPARTVPAPLARQAVAPIAAARAVPTPPSRLPPAIVMAAPQRVATRTDAPAPAQRAASDTAMPDGMTPVRATTLRDAPDGERHLAQVPAGQGTVVTPLARDRGWVRIRVEGWVPEADLAPADSALRVSLSAADLRADPRGARGRVVRWDVEVLALQIADPLRRDLAADEPYLLARGPGAENALLYLAVPPSLLGAARALPALTPITVTARVRNGRSEPVGVPILDLQTITRR